MPAREPARLRMVVCEVAEVSGEVVVALAQGDELIGDVERGQDSDTQGVDRGPTRGDRTHLAVDHGGEALEVLGIDAAEVIDLVVDLDDDGLRDERLRLNRSQGRGRVPHGCGITGAVVARVGVAFASSIVCLLP